MKKYRAEARFNPEDEDERRAWDFLQASKLSQSKTIIAALNAYAEQIDERQRQDAFCERIICTIQSALHGIGAGMIPLPVSAAPIQNEQEQRATEEAMDEFLEYFK